MNHKKITKTTFRPDGTVESIEETEYDFDDGLNIATLPRAYRAATPWNTPRLKENINELHDAVYEAECDCD